MEEKNNALQKEMASFVGKDINDREYRIIVPKWDNSGRKIKAEELQAIAQKMSDHFGGVTIYPSVVGCWWSDDRKFICEENAVFVSFADSESSEDWKKQIQDDERFVFNLAKELGERFGQATVSVGKNNVEVAFLKGQYLEELPRSRVGHDWFKKYL